MRVYRTSTFPGDHELHHPGVSFRYFLIPGPRQNGSSWVYLTGDDLAVEHGLPEEKCLIYNGHGQLDIEMLEPYPELKVITPFTPRPRPLPRSSPAPLPAPQGQQ